MKSKQGMQQHQENCFLTPYWLFQMQGSWTEAFAVPTQLTACSWPKQATKKLSQHKANLPNLKPVIETVTLASKPNPLPSGASDFGRGFCQVRTNCWGFLPFF